jgi:hypothetical protein
MGAQKIYPTCRICEKLNHQMTHCAVYGPISPENIDNTALGSACAKSGDYVRLIHAQPNEYNYGRTPTGEKIDEKADSELLVFDAVDEAEGFEIRHGMTLEEWAKITFGEKE